MKTIILAGVPGCGKSSILREVTQKLPSITVVNYGDKMLEEAHLNGVTRDMLRKMPLGAQQKIGIEAARKIAQEKNKITLIDTHALIRTNIGFCPGLPKEVLHLLSPSACVWIECLPSCILERRAQDPSRSRDKETEEELSLHQELTRAYLAACCMETGALLCRITNNDPSIEKNALPFIQLLRTLQD